MGHLAHLGSFEPDFVDNFLKNFTSEVRHTNNQ
jgi:hypothetical protein